MAISDTLSQATYEIRDYIENQPTMYAAVRADLDRLLGDMERIREILDRPEYDPTGPFASLNEAVRHTVGKIIPRD